MSDTIIIAGAGAAGLMAACELAGSYNVIVLEASHSPGGRIHTRYHTSFQQPLETGAEFVHGNLPITLQLLQQAGIDYKPVAGEMIRIEKSRWQGLEETTEGWDELMQRMQEIKSDMTLHNFLNTFFADERYSSLRAAVTRFAQGFDLADPERVSIKALEKEWEHQEEEQYRIPGGYQQLIHWLADECRKKGGRIHTDTIVKNITWRKGQVVVTTADGQVFNGNKAIITVSLGVLQASPADTAAIAFMPALDTYRQAALEMGNGTVVKIVLQFKEAFWTKYRDDIGFLLSAEAIPTWWTQQPTGNAVLTGWLGGPPAAAIENEPEATILQMALQSLANIFSTTVTALQQQLTAFFISHWQQNPFTRGAYSYTTLQTLPARKILTTPVEDTLFFAGEALYNGDAQSTVEAALTSGKEVAHKIHQQQ